MKTNQISRALNRNRKGTLFFCTVILLAIICTIQSCEKEGITESKTEVIQFETSKTSAVGFIQSTSNVPISNAIIKLGDQKIARSDQYGKFILEDNFEIGDVITIEHPGFVTLYKVINENTKFFFLMKERAQSNRINSDSESVINVGPGGQIIIPPNAFSNNGVMYNGPIDIRATYIDVTDDAELESAPGAYISENNPGTNLSPLESYGMMEITATIPGTSSPLTLVDGKSIRVSFPILDGDTTEKINLYELNRTSGYWSSTGVLTTVNNTLQGSITSVNNGYNADRPCANELICVRIRIEYTNGDPGCGIGAMGLTYRGFDGLYVPDENGYIQFWVCPNNLFQLRACRSKKDTYNKIIYPSTSMSNVKCMDLGVWTINN